MFDFDSIVFAKRHEKEFSNMTKAETCRRYLKSHNCTNNSAMLERTDCESNPLEEFNELICAKVSIEFVYSGYYGYSKWPAEDRVSRALVFISNFRLK